MSETKSAMKAGSMFEFTGGRLCLDFTNTVADRPSEKPQELLTCYSDIVAWGQQAHIIRDEEARQLFKEATQQVREADAIHRQALVVREAIYRIFLAITRGASPQEADLLLINEALSKTMPHIRIASEGNGFTWGWTTEEGVMERVIWPVVRGAADLLTSDELHAVRVCAAEDCGWLFLDTSKNHSRHWCNMKSCGNRAKVRRHNERKKQATQPLA